MCGDLENCDVLSEIPDCNEINTRNNLDGGGGGDGVVDGSVDGGETTNRNYYNVVVKRDTNYVNNIRNANQTGPYRLAPRKHSPNMKIKIYTKISKGLGLWNQNISRAENIQIVTKELKTYHTNEDLRNRLYTLRINVKHLNLEENLLCRSGSVLKRSVCGKFIFSIHFVFFFSPSLAVYSVVCFKCSFFFPIIH